MAKRTLCDLDSGDHEKIRSRLGKGRATGIDRSDVVGKDGKALSSLKSYTEILTGEDDHFAIGSRKAPAIITETSLAGISLKETIKTKSQNPEHFRCDRIDCVAGVMISVVSVLVLSFACRGDARPERRCSEDRTWKGVGDGYVDKEAMTPCGD